MANITKAQRGPASVHAARPSRFGPLLRTLAAPFVWIAKAYSTLTIHTSSWFIGLTSSWEDPTYQNLAERTLSNPVASRCYQLVSETMSSIRLYAARETTSDDGDMVLEEDDDNPFMVVLERPNAFEPSYQKFVKQIVADLWFGGEIFMYTPKSVLTGPEAGLPNEEFGIVLIRPDRMIRIETDADGLPAFYHWVDSTATPRKTVAARIQHIRTVNPLAQPDKTRGERGYPLAKAVWDELQLMQSGNDWNHSVFENKGRLPGFFKYVGKGRFDEAQYKRTKEHIQTSYKNDSEKSMPGLLDADYEFIETSTNQKEADWLRGAQQYARWIAIGLGVDPALIGDQGSRTLANLSIAVKALYTLTVIPILDWLLDEWNARYMVKYGEEKLYIDREGIDALQEDRTEVVKRAVVAVGAPIATREEGRVMVGLDAEAVGTFFGPAPIEEEEDESGNRLDLLSEDQLLAYAKSLWQETEDA